MRIEFPEEATTLLEEQRVVHREGGARVRDKRKKRAVCTAIAVIAAVGAIAGCVVAIDVAAMHHEAEVNLELKSHADDVGYGLTSDLEQQSGMISWKGFSHAWCKVHSAFKAYTYCELVHSTQVCQDEAYSACAAAANSTSGGSGSGSGSW